MLEALDFAKKQTKRKLLIPVISVLGRLRAESQPFKVCLIKGMNGEEEEHSWCVVHACNPNTGEAEVGRLPRLQDEILSLKTSQL